MEGYESAAMLFPIDDLLDEAACYRLLLQALHPEGPFAVSASGASTSTSRSIRACTTSGMTSSGSSGVCLGLSPQREHEPVVQQHTTASAMQEDRRDEFAV